MPFDAASRTAWNAGRYTQVKAYVDPDLAAAFKAACAGRGESMAAVLSRAMAGYIGQQPGKKPRPAREAPDYSTRGKRRAATVRIAGQLEEIRAAEEAYFENIPENLQSGARYESAEQTVAALEDAIEVLGGAFQDS